MIANEFQYKLTKAQVAKFEEAVASLKDHVDGSADIHPLLQQAERDALRSQLDSLRADLAQYDALRSGKQRSFSAGSFDELPEALIKARIAAGLTQKQLAARIGVKEQQIQRYEASGYASASMKRVGEVIKALGVQVREEIALR